MSSIATVTLAAVPALPSLQTITHSEVSTVPQIGSATSTPPKDPRGPTLSSDAAAVLLEEQNKVPVPAARSVYETYMPVREGFTAHALAVGVQEPDAVSSSAGLDDAGVAADARARLDEKYARMAASGKAFGSVPGGMLEDWLSLTGDLDRRSLASIVDDESGLFTKDEKLIAGDGLQRQDGMRLGGYSGPSSLFGQFVASGLSCMSGRDADDAMRAFDKSAAQNKSLKSLLGRAAMRVLLGVGESRQLFGDPQVKASDKMLTLLVDALTKAREKDPEVLNKLDSIKGVDDLKKADWFAEFRSKLEELIEDADAG